MVLQETTNKMTLLKSQFQSRDKYLQWLIAQCKTSTFTKVSIISSNGSRVQLNAVLLSYALPYLNVDTDTESLFLEKECNVSSLSKLVTLICEGEISTESLKEEETIFELCQLLHMNVSYHQAISEDDHHYDDTLPAEVEELESPRKAKAKRQFTATLSTADLTCDICDRVFTAMYKLKIHRLIHSSSPPFVCSHCGKCHVKSIRGPKYLIIYNFRARIQQ